MYLENGLFALGDLKIYKINLHLWTFLKHFKLISHVWSDPNYFAAREVSNREDQSYL